MRGCGGRCDQRAHPRSCVKSAQREKKSHRQRAQESQGDVVVKKTSSEEAEVPQCYILLYINSFFVLYTHQGIEINKTDIDVKTRKR